MNIDRGRCPACHAEVPLYSDGTVKAHVRRDGTVLDALDPWACEGTRFSPMRECCGEGCTDEATTECRGYWYCSDHLAEVGR